MILFVAFLALSALVDSQLVAVQLVSRHGTRSPDAVVWDICPNERPNLQKYIDEGISLSGMTGKGMKQLYDLGIYSRQRYIESGFLSEQFLTHEVYVQAVGSERTMQSAVCWSQAMYPPAEYPVNYYKDQTYPVPVYSMPDNVDNVLESRKAACKKQLALDSDEWDKSKGPALWAQSDIIEGLSKACGQNLSLSLEVTGWERLGDAIKDITDAITFDFSEGYDLIVSEEKFEEYREIAVAQLLDRLLGKPSQVTYMNGGLPHQLISNWNDVLKGKGYKMWSYHGHREMMYAFGKILKIDFDYHEPGMPKGAIPAGTSVFLELHNTSEGYVVQTWVWSPCKNRRGLDILTSKAPDAADFDCPAQLVVLPGCGVEDCPLERWNKILTDHIDSTGTWDQLCHHEARLNAYSGVSVESSSASFYFLLSVVLIGAMGAYYYLINKNRFAYSELP